MKRKIFTLRVLKLKTFIVISPFLLVVWLSVKESSGQSLMYYKHLQGTLSIMSDDFAHYENSVACLTCHVLNNAPGAQLTMIAGNANLCLSCHNAAGTAFNSPFSDADRAEPGVSGTSHSWNEPAVNDQYGASFPVNSNMAGKVMDGQIVCSTCHQPHYQFYPPYFLRTSNDQDIMCKDCHSVRNIGTYADNPENKGSHPVGKEYPGTDPDYYAVPQDPNIVLVGTKIECTSCHGVHYTSSGNANGGTGDGYLLRTVNDDNLCTSCHTYGSHEGMSCSACHQPHNANRTNIYMVRDALQTPSSGTKNVVFTMNTGLNSYADGDSNYDGICEVCHTSTTYHRNNASGDHTHHPGEKCVTCHPHSDHFAPAGGCLDCHNVAQDNGDGIPVGGRRAVAGEFPAGSTHAHYGAVLDEADCQVCHSTATHMSGYVKLIDPDDGSILSFVIPETLQTSPDVSDFCMGCHDDDGALIAANPFDPFNNGNASPDVATRFMGTLQWNEWYGDFCFGNEGTLRGVNSHHDISDADHAFSGAEMECLNCHGSHTVSASAPLVDPYNPTTIWSGSDNAFCLTCHDGGTGPASPDFPAGVYGPTIAMRGLDNCSYTGTPWWVDYTWTNSAHGLASKRVWPGYSGAPQYEVLCKDCHDPHGSYTETNTLGNPYMIRDYVDGTSYVDDGVRPGPQWTGPPWNTFGTSRAVRITISGTVVNWGSAEGLCGVCHANWLGAYSWHSSCNGCQTCHGHGQAWDNYDWGPAPDNSVACPTRSSHAVLDSNQYENPTIFHLNQK